MDKYVKQPPTNVALVVVTDRQRILLVRDKKTSKWMTPGGKIEPKDKSLFEAALREFKEETSFDLSISDISNIQTYEKLGHTIIFIVHTSQRFGKFQPTNETDKIHFTKVLDLFSGKFTRNNGPLKSYVENSFVQTRIDGIL